MAPRQLFLWLQPEPAAAAELDTMIARLAAAHDTAVFAPHLTLLALPEQPGQPEQGAQAEQSLVSTLDQVADQLSPLAITFSETRCEHAWRRSLYLAAVAEPAIRRAFEVAVRAFAVPGKPAFEPHLSLLYSQLPVADKLRLAAGLAIEMPRTVRFDRLSVWHAAGSDASRWRLVASRRLAETRGQRPS